MLKHNGAQCTFSGACFKIHTIGCNKGHFWLDLQSDCHFIRSQEQQYLFWKLVTVKVDSGFFIFIESIFHWKFFMEICWSVFFYWKYVLLEGFLLKVFFWDLSKWIQVGNTTIVFYWKYFSLKVFYGDLLKCFFLLKICFIGRFFIESVLLRSVEVDSGG